VDAMYEAKGERGARTAKQSLPLFTEHSTVLLTLTRR
jgi:hypothetical protein